jgi:hypothetical protein
VVGHQGLLEAARAVHLVRDEQRPLGDGERPQVERLVMQDSEGQAVGLHVRAPRLVPADVGSVEGYRERAEPDVKPADGTTVLKGWNVSDECAYKSIGSSVSIVHCMIIRSMATPAEHRGIHIPINGCINVLALTKPSRDAIVAIARTATWGSGAHR